MYTLDNFEHKGEWWLPEDPENKIKGVFKFIKDKGFILELMGAFKKDLNDNKYSAPEIILGLVDSGKITLHNCYISRFSMSNLLNITNYSVNLSFLGYHFEKKEDICFKKIDVHYSNSNDWINISGLDVKYLSNSTIATYTRPEPIKLNINNNLTISISIRSAVNERKNKIQLKETSYIQFEFNEELPFEDCIKYVIHLRNFLSIGTGNLIYPIHVNGETKLNMHKYGNEFYYDSIKIYGLFNFNIKLVDVIFPNMPFNYQDPWISSHLEEILKKWFKMTEYLEPTYLGYFQTIYDRPNHATQLFLALAQSLESYHKYSKMDYSGKYFDKRKPYKKNVYAPIRNFINEDMALNNFINEQLDANNAYNLKKDLKERIRFGNEAFLSKKLTEIIEINSDCLDLVIHDKDYFIEKIKCTRDYLTHFSENQKECSLKGDELIEMCFKLQLIMEMLLLKEIDFKSHIISNLIKSRRHNNKLVIYE